MSTCIVTCGPASTRIDEVRRITNFSTGELGTLLSEALLAAGHQVICLRGEGATYRSPKDVAVESFFTNQDMLVYLEKISSNQTVDYLFHAAALTDFEVAAVVDEAGNPLLVKKISSSTKEINIRLLPAPKIISELRRLFPHTNIIGWKYELNGNNTTAEEKARLQIQTCQTDACVVNGAAVGKDFFYLTKEKSHQLSDKLELVQFLVQSIVER